MLIIRGTKKLRERVKGPLATEADESTGALGDWFANALFWRPQVVLLVNRRTYLSMLVPLAPATTLLQRIPAQIEAVLRLHGVDEAFIESEVAAMDEVRIAATNDRSTLGVMNSLTDTAEFHRRFDGDDLQAIAVQLARELLGPLGMRTPAEELATLSGATSLVGQVLQLRITLQGIEPPIWRRVLVEPSLTLDYLDRVIQAAFGWEGRHLHAFEVDGVRYGVPDGDDWVPVVDERRARLDVVARAGQFSYEYDFGDGWDHEVVCEAIIDRPAGVIYSACIAGARACPPEDCGGVPGYEKLLVALADSDHPEHDHLQTWLGRPYDPESFDPDEFRTNLVARYR